MRNKLLAGLGGAVLVAGCATPTTVVLKDSQTIHNADASRIWIVEQSPEGQKIVLCDVAMLQQTKTTLCIRWPPP
jgi:hypothetical protein